MVIGYVMKQTNQITDIDKKMGLFKKYFCISSTLSVELINLLDFLQTLEEQERNIFLDLKSVDNTNNKLIDKTFIELLIRYLDEADFGPKEHILRAIEYIIKKHGFSREYVINNIKAIEKLANCDHARISTISKNILRYLNSSQPDLIRPEYTFSPNQEFTYAQQITKILSSAKIDLIIFDNYINHEILNYLKLCSNIKNLTDIYIITSFKNKSGLDNLEFIKEKFSKEYSTIKIHIAKSKSIHDRYFIVDKEIFWCLGPSIKDGGDKLSSIHQITDFNEKCKIIEQFNIEFKNDSQA